MITKSRYDIDLVANPKEAHTLLSKYGIADTSHELVMKNLKCILDNDGYNDYVMLSKRSQLLVRIPDGLLDHNNENKQTPVSEGWVEGTRSTECFQIGFIYESLLQYLMIALAFDKSKEVATPDFIERCSPLMKDDKSEGQSKYRIPKELDLRKGTLRIRDFCLPFQTTMLCDKGIGCFLEEPLLFCTAVLGIDHDSKGKNRIDIKKLSLPSISHFYNELLDVKSINDYPESHLFFEDIFGYRMTLEIWKTVLDFLEFKRRNGQSLALSNNSKTELKINEKAFREYISEIILWLQDIVSMASFIPCTEIRIALVKEALDLYLNHSIHIFKDERQNTDDPEEEKLFSEDSQKMSELFRLFSNNSQAFKDCINYLWIVFAINEPSGFSQNTRDKLLESLRKNEVHRIKTLRETYYIEEIKKLALFYWRQETGHRLTMLSRDISPFEAVIGLARKTEANDIHFVDIPVKIHVGRRNPSNEQCNDQIVLANIREASSDDNTKSDDLVNRLQEIRSRDYHKWEPIIHETSESNDSVCAETLKYQEDELIFMSPEDIKTQKDFLNENWDGIITTRDFHLYLSSIPTDSKLLYATLQTLVASELI